MEPIAAPDGIQSATAIFRSLVADRLSDKYKAVELLNDPARSIDLATLRTLLLKAINKDFYAGKEEEQDDPTIARTRSWLLGTLARISTGDDEATELVVRHVDKKSEPYDWARYWSLEGLISGKNAAAKAVATDVADNDDDPMVSMLATAYLGSLNDGKASQKTRKCLNEPALNGSFSGRCASFRFQPQSQRSAKSRKRPATLTRPTTQLWRSARFPATGHTPRSLHRRSRHASSRCAGRHGRMECARAQLPVSAI